MNHNFWLYSKKIYILASKMPWLFDDFDIPRIIMKSPEDLGHLTFSIWHPLRRATQVELYSEAHVFKTLYMVYGIASNFVLILVCFYCWLNWLMKDVTVNIHNIVYITLFFLLSNSQFNYEIEVKFKDIWRVPHIHGECLFWNFQISTGGPTFNVSRFNY